MALCAGWRRSTAVPAISRSPSYYERLQADLVAFRERYVDYLNRTLGAGLSAGPSFDADRSRLMKLATLAGQAVSSTGIRIALLPAPAFGGVALEGLAQVAFAHEGRWSRSAHFGAGHFRQPYEEVLDTIDKAEAALGLMAAEARRRRRNPLYWGDRVLRAVLGFPAYLVSLVLGFDRRQLSPRAEQSLWLFSVAADAVTSTLHFQGALQSWDV